MKSIFLQPQRSFKTALLTGCFNALFAFAILLAYSRWRDVEVTASSPYTLITYALFNIAIYGMFASPAAKLIDEKRYHVIATLILIACLVAAVTNLLAFMNVFTQWFDIESFNRILYPQVGFGVICLGLYIFAAALTE